MTNEEAITMLERLKETIKILEQLKDKLNYEVTDSQKKMDALNMAIQALKRHIPKRVNYSKSKDSCVESALCPICLTEYDTSVEWRTPYCYECGQALKWEIEEGEEI